jgi:hypothetical protein
MELDIPPQYFEPCGVCGSNPKMTEIFTNLQAEQANIGLTTSDNDELITDGMLSLEVQCAGRRDTCVDVEIRIPAAKYDKEMEVWNTSRATEGSWVRYERSELEYDAKNKWYIMKVSYCTGDMKNIDKPRRRYPVGYIAVPELDRSKKGTKASAAKSGYVFRNSEEGPTIWTFRYANKGTMFFTDSGLAKSRVGYKFSGNIDRYHAECDTFFGKLDTSRWCFEIPLDQYSKIIYFQKKKKYRLKVPFKYRDHAVRLFIPAADTILTIAKKKGSSRVYTFQKPLPDTYVVFYKEGSDINNKRGYEYQVDLEKVRTKYKKRKKYYKAKIKRSQLKVRS